MADRRYRPVNFGFLNTAQDSTDIGEFESPNAVNLDSDELALGALKHNQYTGLGTLKDFEETDTAGRTFTLGSLTDAYTTYIASGSFLSADTISFPNAQPFFWAFDVEFSSTADGYVVGNTSTPSLGTAYVEVLSGNLVYKRHDGTSFATSITAVTTIATGTPYRVVVSKGTDLERVYVNGQFAGQATVSVSSAENVATAFEIGGGALFDLKNLYLAEGEAQSPNLWDGLATTSVDFTGTVTPILSSRIGSGLDSQPNRGFASSGVAPVTTSGVLTKGAGSLYAELQSSDPTVVTQVAKSLYTQKSPAPAEASKIDVDVPLGSAVYVRFKMQADGFFSTGTADLTQTLFQFNNVSGTPERFQIRASQATSEIQVRLEDSVGFNAWAAISSLGDATAEREYVAILYSKADGSGDALVTSVGGTIQDTQTTTNTPLPIFSEANSVSIPPDIAYTGTGSSTAFYRDISVGNLTGNLTQLDGWSGTYDDLVDRFSVVEQVGAPDGNLINNTQGLTATAFAATDEPTLFAEETGTIPKAIDKVADGVAPTTPKPVSVSLADGLEIDDSSLPSGWAVVLNDNRGYKGPSVLNMEIETATYNSAAYWVMDIIRKLEGQRRRRGTSQTNKINLTHGLSLIADNTVTSPTTINNGGAGYDISISSPELLDGEYKYRLVAVRKDDVDPNEEIESIPSDPIDIKVSNIGDDGARLANLVPQVEVPGIRPGYPDYTDRFDIYRADPDSEDYVKIKEHSSTTPLSFVDSSIISALPKIEFLKTTDDETFSDIDEATSNDSGNYFMLFNKDNRLWAVPSDRKDLLLFSRENDWWGWSRENSFSFNGDITDVVAIRDINVVNGESTLVIFTTKGIYHIVGSGVESSLYLRVPMFGGDGQSDIDTYAGSALPFNGSIFFLAKSSDGGYETGAYGQKVYEYNLQQLVELSGRIKKTGTLDGDTNEMEFVSLLAGDKYILKKLTNDTCLVYHKDARGWLTYSATGGADWEWESKKFDRQSRERGTVANASRFKIDYKGDLIITFKIWNGDDPTDSNNYSEKTASLSSATRTQFESMLPSNMGPQWSFKLESDSDTTAEVYNMWFV
jgi:hypothetical protein